MDLPEWFKFLFFTLAMAVMAFLVWICSRILTTAQEISSKENTIQSTVSSLEPSSSGSGGGGLSIQGLIQTGETVASILAL